MLKTYISPSGNRKVYVRTGWREYMKNGSLMREPVNFGCQFMPLFVTEDPIVQEALEKHEFFNHDFLPMVKELEHFKTIRQIVPEAKGMDERDAVIKQAKIVGVAGNLVEMTTEQIKKAVENRKQELESPKVEPLAQDNIEADAPEMQEAPEAAEAEARQSDAPKKRGRPKRAK